MEKNNRVWEESTKCECADVDVCGSHHRSAPWRACVSQVFPRVYCSAFISYGCRTLHPQLLSSPSSLLPRQSPVLVLRKKKERRTRTSTELVFHNTLQTHKLPLRRFLTTSLLSNAAPIEQSTQNATWQPRPLLLCRGVASAH
jgi:hypothetical protein